MSDTFLGPRRAREGLALEDQLGALPASHPALPKTESSHISGLSEVSCVLPRLESCPGQREMYQKGSDQRPRGLGVRTGGLLPL